MIRVTNFPCNLTKHISVEDYSNVKNNFEKKSSTRCLQKSVVAGREGGGRWRQVGFLKYEHNAFYHHPGSQRN